jgi:hypothetical protein
MSKERVWYGDRGSRLNSQASVLTQHHARHCDNALSSDDAGKENFNVAG